MKNDGAVPSPRISPGIEYYENSLYMWGASEYNYTSKESYYLYKYDLINQTWSIIQTTGTPPELRNYHGVSIINDTFYVYLGFNYVNGDDIESIYKISLINFMWEEVLITGTQIITRNMFAKITLNQMIWVFCGVNSTRLYNSILLYNFINSTITTIFPTTETMKRRHSYSLNRAGESMLLFGGYDQSKM